MGNADVRIEPEPLEKVYVELSTACNLDCAMCFRQTYETDIHALMPKHVFDAVFSQIDDIATIKDIVIGGIGEPLMSPFWREAVRLVKRSGKRVVITTNGLLVDRKTAESLVDEGVDEVVISVEAGSLGHNNVENTLAVGEMIQEIKKDRGSVVPGVAAEVVLTKSSLADDMKIVKELPRHGIKYVLLNNLMPTNAEYEKEVLYVKGHESQLKAEIYHELYGKIVAEYPEFYVRTERYCRFVERRAAVVSNEGTVVPCYRFLHTGQERVFGRQRKVYFHGFGNVLEKHLADIWASPDYTIYRFKVRYGLYPSCVDCVFRDGCGFLDDTMADCWGNMPSCADCLWYRQIILCP
ncbi:radical SAM protein [Coprothermobacteraceae bacterium]|nr:radical SAM protein [Coprothermobacteraceae bacterium]